MSKIFNVETGCWEDECTLIADGGYVNDLSSDGCIHDVDDNPDGVIVISKDDDGNICKKPLSGITCTTCTEEVLYINRYGVAEHTYVLNGPDDLELFDFPVTGTDSDIYNHELPANYFWDYNLGIIYQTATSTTGGAPITIAQHTSNNLDVVHSTVEHWYGDMLTYDPSLYDIGAPWDSIPAHIQYTPVIISHAAEWTTNADPTVNIGDIVDFYNADTGEKICSVPVSLNNPPQIITDVIGPVFAAGFVEQCSYHLRVPLTDTTINYNVVNPANGNILTSSSYTYPDLTALPKSTTLTFDVLGGGVDIESSSLELQGYNLNDANALHDSISLNNRSIPISVSDRTGGGNNQEFSGTISPFNTREEGSTDDWGISVDYTAQNSRNHIFWLKGEFNTVHDTVAEGVKCVRPDGTVEYYLDENGDPLTDLTNVINP